MTGHITILEGPDCSGKTTIGRYLENAMRNHRFNTKYTHHGPYLDRKNIAPFYADAVRAADMTTNMFISDRSWFSEYVYGEVYRGGINRIQPYQRRMLERLYLTYSPVVLRCLPPYEICRDKFLSRKSDEYINSEYVFKQIYDAYYNLTFPGFSVVNYDYTVQQKNEIYANIIESRPLKNKGPGAGRWFPDVNILIVGDKVNIKQNSELTNIPFFNPRFNLEGCSSWLADQLEIAGVPESALYWVNAFNAADKPLDYSFIEDLRPREIITLGTNAGEWCSRGGYECINVPHPQYWKRFNKNSEYPLIKVLRKIFKGSTIL